MRATSGQKQDFCMKTITVLKGKLKENFVVLQVMRKSDVRDYCYYYIVYTRNEEKTIKMKAKN